MFQFTTALLFNVFVNDSFICLNFLFNVFSYVFVNNYRLLILKIYLLIHMYVLWLHGLFEKKVKQIKPNNSSEMMMILSGKKRSRTLKPVFSKVNVST